MKVFISWSGIPSEKCALALRDWLPLVLPNITPFVSSEDIRKGNQWRTKISKELAETKFGIACLTTENTSAPWLLFETGALSKSLEETSVCTLLIPPLKSEAVKGPLSGFQHTSFNKDDFWKLISTLNSLNGDNALPQERLSRVFEKWWGDLESAINQIITATPAKAVSERSERDMIAEILDLTRSIARATSDGQEEQPVSAELAHILKTRETLVSEIAALAREAQDTTEEIAALRKAGETTTEKDQKLTMLNQLISSRKQQATIIESYLDSLRYLSATRGRKGTQVR